MPEERPARHVRPDGTHAGGKPFIRRPSIGRSRGGYQFQDAPISDICSQVDVRTIRI